MGEGVRTIHAPASTRGRCPAMAKARGSATGNRLLARTAESLSYNPRQAALQLMGLSGRSPAGRVTKEGPWPSMAGANALDCRSACFDRDDFLRLDRLGALWHGYRQYALGEAGIDLLGIYALG